MKCSAHAEVDATGFCRNCGRALCAQCTRDVQGALYCEECLAALVARPQPPGAGSATPVLAALLGFVPGLGAVYNGEYVKALIHIGIFAGLVALLNSDQPEGYQVFLGLLLAAFIFYMPIDAYRTARAKLAGPSPAAGAGAAGTTATPASAPACGPAPGDVNWLAGPVVLIGLGVVFLLANLGWLHTRWLSHSWPLALIGVGAWLLWRGLG